MHELYLAEQIIQEVIKKAHENKAKKVLEATIIIPQNEHFTEKEFQSILEMQAKDTPAGNAKFKVSKEATSKIYIKDIKISKK